MSEEKREEVNKHGNPSKRNQKHKNEMKKVKRKEGEMTDLFFLFMYSVPSTVLIPVMNPCSLQNIKILNKWL